MLNSCLQFPKANMKLIMEKVREALKPVYKEFIAEYSPKESEGNGVLEYRRLRSGRYQWYFYFISFFNIKL